MFQKIEKETGSKAKCGNVPKALRRQAEQKSGISLQDVVVHYNSPEPSRFQAFGYALGEDIYLAPGREKDLSHELWHVVQQKQGRVRPMQKLEGKNLNTDVWLEQEADRWQSMNSLYYPHQQETSCIQRLVLVGVGDEEEEVTPEMFIEKFVEYLYTLRRMDAKEDYDNFLSAADRLREIYAENEATLWAIDVTIEELKEVYEKITESYDKYFGESGRKVPEVNNSPYWGFPDGDLRLNLNLFPNMMYDLTKMISKKCTYNQNGKEQQLEVVYSFRTYEDLILKLISKNYKHFNNIRSKVNVANVGQGDSIMLETPGHDVMIDMGQPHSTGRAFSCKSIRGYSKRSWCSCILPLYWKDFKLRLDALSKKYRALLMAMYRNSIFFDKSQDIQENNLWLNCIDVRDIYLKWNRKYDQDIVPDDIDREFWDWEPIDEKIDLEQKRDFYKKAYSFYDMLSHLMVAFLFDSSDLIDFPLENIECLDDLEKYGITNPRNPQAVLELLEKYPRSDDTNDPSVPSEQDLLQYFHCNRLEQKFCIPECMCNKATMNKEEYDFVRQAVDFLTSKYKNRGEEVDAMHAINKIFEFFMEEFNLLFAFYGIIGEQEELDSKGIHFEFDDFSSREGHEHRAISWISDKQSVREPCSNSGSDKEPKPQIENDSKVHDLDTLMDLYKKDKLEVGTCMDDKFPLKKFLHKVYKSLISEDDVSRFCSFLKKLYPYTLYEVPFVGGMKKRWTEELLTGMRPINTHNHQDHTGNLQKDQMLVMGLSDLVEKKSEIEELLNAYALHMVNGSENLPNLNKDQKNANYDSLMIYHELRNHRVYFLGDSPLKNLNSECVQFPEPTKNHVLMVPHHGSTTSVSEHLPDKLLGLQTTYFIISAGAGNKYSLPNSPKLSLEKDFGKDYKWRGIPIMDGTIIPAADFLGRKTREDGTPLTGNIIVYTTMNMGFWEDGKENTRAPGYVVADMNNIYSKLVVYKKIMQLPASDKSSIHAYNQAVEMAEATAYNKFIDKLIKHNLNEANRQIQERILELLKQESDLSNKRIAELIPAINIDGHIIKPLEHHVNQNINLLKEKDEVKGKKPNLRINKKQKSEGET